ncbi:MULTISPECIES: hypothetical protein [Asticcacaulis]|uniref:hypothetical protein n=1 Tax=Asticcacaulis TaxID=76890 RepID=UPI001AE829D1|nr:MULTISPECIES: hypothetical protein [Asticcacaulis]MBP2158551.1 hypothetical protein [Asticcacaulis solisilvae]MDR6799597.1 hypothetical protein [Asticcacaulis sp. BE141]
MGAAVMAVLGAAGAIAFGSQAQDSTTSRTEAQTSQVQTANAARLSQVKAADVNLAATPAAVAAAPVAVQRPTTSTSVAARPPAPMLLRRPLAPAKVQWSQAMSRSNQMKTARRSNNLAARLPRQQLDKTRLPVILPREGVIDTARAKMVSFGDAYALNMPQNKGIQVTMYGNRTFVAGDKGAVSARPVQKLAGVTEDIRISQMEDGWTATFTRFGVVYSLDVTCDDVKAADCVTDAYIRKAIAEFDDVTLGAQAQAEADKETKPTGWLDNISKSISNITKGGQ